MRTQYTRGPWQALPEEVDKDYIRIRGTVLGGKYKVANVLCTSGHPSEAEEVRANARLISAAPLLLEALELAESVYRQNCVSIGEPSTVLKAMQKAIAAAKVNS